MSVITTTDTLAEVCAGLTHAEFVTVDTEFVRETTYWPNLCLVQLAGANADDAWCVDPLAHGIDLSPLYELLSTNTVLKVFHSGRQDIEIFYHQADLIPTPVFDTQVAATVCGFGDQVAYEQLARQLAGARIDKASRFTDWSKRPLSTRQLSYALADVIHLRPIYKALKSRLETSRRAHWLDEEMHILTDPATYDLQPENAWRRVKIRVNRARDYTIAKRLGVWRERMAQTRNVPRGRILKDDQINEIAKQKPRSLEALRGLRNFPKRLANKANGGQIIAIIDAVLELPEKNLDRAPRDRQFAAKDSAAIELLKVLLKHVCEMHHVAPRLIATTRDIETLTRNPDADIPALRGWRREIFGANALRLLRGEVVVGYRDRAVQVLPAPKD